MAKTVTITAELPTGNVEILTVENGQNHRQSVSPVDDISHLPADIRARIEAHRTPAMLAAWKQVQADEAIPLTAYDVQAEARRRIAALVGADDTPEDITEARFKRMREQVRALKKPSQTPAQKRRLDKLDAEDDQIDRIQAAAKALEKKPPSTYRKDKHWPAKQPA